MVKSLSISLDKAEYKECVESILESAYKSATGDGDITLRAAGKKVPVHRAILAASSPLMKNLLVEQPSCGDIIVDGATESDLRKIAILVYAGEVHFSSESTREHFSSVLRVLGITGISSSHTPGCSRSSSVMDRDFSLSEFQPVVRLMNLDVTERSFCVSSEAKQTNGSVSKSHMDNESHLKRKGGGSKPPVKKKRHTDSSDQLQAKSRLSDGTLLPEPVVSEAKTNGTLLPSNAKNPPVKKKKHTESSDQTQIKSRLIKGTLLPKPFVSEMKTETTSHKERRLIRCLACFKKCKSEKSLREHKALCLVNSQFRALTDKFFKCRFCSQVVVNRQGHMEKCGSKDKESSKEENRAKKPESGLNTIKCGSRDKENGAKKTGSGTNTLRKPQDINLKTFSCFKEKQENEKEETDPQKSIKSNAKKTFPTATTERLLTSSQKIGLNSGSSKESQDKLGFICTCGLNFEKDREAAKHLLTNSRCRDEFKKTLLIDDYDVVVCSICSWRIGAEIDFKQHFLRCSTSNQWPGAMECHECKCNSKSRSMTKHMRVVHNDSESSGDERSGDSGMTFTSGQRTNSEVFKCIQCFQIMNRDELVTHLQKKTCNETKFFTTIEPDVIQCRLCDWRLLIGGFISHIKTNCLAADQYEDVTICTSCKCHVKWGSSHICSGGVVANIVLSEDEDAKSDFKNGSGPGSTVRPLPLNSISCKKCKKVFYSSREFDVHLMHLCFKA